MAFADAQTTGLVSGYGPPLFVTSDGAWKAGDLIGISGGSFVRADSDGTIYAEFVAGRDAPGASIASIPLYRAALVKDRITGATAGNPLYLSDTAGKCDESAGTNKQHVGFSVSATEVFLAPEYKTGGQQLGGPLDMNANIISNIGNAGTDFLANGGLTLANALTVTTGGITVTGNSTITGTLGGVTTLTATSLAGTLTTAAQPNVTSLGALTALNVSGVVTVTSASDSALKVGRQGATDPAFTVDASTSTNVTGVKVRGAAATAGAFISVTSTQTNEDLWIDAKGSGMINLGNSSTGVIRLLRALNPTLGVIAAGGFTASPRNVHTGGAPALVTTSGTNVTDNVAGTVYLAEVFVPANVSVTGVAVFNGTAVAGNGKVMLYDSAGARVAISASTAMSGTTAYQLIPFTGGPIAVVGPASYFVGVIYDTTTHDLRHHTIGTFATGTDTGNTYATDSTFATVTLPTTFTTEVGPIASLY